jgi:hypothetical protein
MMEDVRNTFEQNTRIHMMLIQFLGVDAGLIDWDSVADVS